VLELRGATKRYGDAIALAPTDLLIEAERTTVLIGPSGCGKSTLLRLLVGLYAPDAGEVRFAGEPLTPDRLAEARQRMGYVIQDGGLFPHLTARANATLMARHLGWSRDRIDERLSNLVALTRLPKEGLARYPHEISGGQRQRVSLMRALFLDPDVVLLDEPLGALDPLVRAELGRDLRAIFSELHKTVVLVTHDLAEAAFFADVVVLLKRGRIVQRGRYEDLVAAPAEPFVRQFVNAQRGLGEAES
jgi:osmoprotectant transport system ATP-binding protein